MFADKDPLRLSLSSNQPAAPGLGRQSRGDSHPRRTVRSKTVPTWPQPGSHCRTKLCPRRWGPSLPLKCCFPSLLMVAPCPLCRPHSSCPKVSKDNPGHRMQHGGHALPWRRRVGRTHGRQLLRRRAEMPRETRGHPSHQGQGPQQSPSVPSAQEAQGASLLSTCVTW